MKTQTIFTTLTLAGGQKCQVMDIKAHHLFKAGIAHRKDELEYDAMAYLIKEVCIIDKNFKDMEYIANMEGSDFIQISKCIGLILGELPGFDPKALYSAS